MEKDRKGLKYFVRTLAIVVGLVLVWRGIWHFLDAIDIYVFGGYDMWTSLAGVVVGIFLLYVPDGDLKEIEKL